tara:strand:+ start:210 stop:689 length:480 start_codon:yes stop_codon:yes gene_type:complete
MTLYLFLLIIVAALMSNSVSLMISGLIYAAVSMLHLMVFGRLDGSDYGYYYASAAMFDCVCAICICMAAACLDKDWHLFPLSLVMILSMLVNMGGLFIWYYGWDSTMYKIAGVTVYLLAATILLGSSLNVGRLLGLNRFGPIHFVADSDGILLDRRKKD